MDRFTLTDFYALIKCEQPEVTILSADIIQMKTFVFVLNMKQIKL